MASGGVESKRTAGRRRPSSASLEAATLRALHEVAIASGTRDLRTVAQIAVDHARDLLGADAAVVFRYEPATGLLTPIYETESEVQEPPVVPGEGAIGRAFETGVAVTIPDYQKWEHSVPQSAARGMVSAVAVPLVVEDRPIGALGVWTYRRRSFRTDHVALLSLFAAQVAPALETARLSGERDAQARVFRSLYEVAVAISQVHQPDALARLVVDSARDVIGADSASLAWWNDQTGLLDVLADNDPYPDQSRYQPGEGAIGIAYQKREGFIIDDYASWPQATELGVASGVQKVAAVPLLVGDQALGSLAVYSYGRLSLSGQHLQLLSLLASQVAPVLQGAELLQASQQQARIFRALHELAVAASGILDPRQVARLAVEHARLVLGVERAVVSQWDAEAGLLKVVAEDDASGFQYPQAARPAAGGASSRAFQLVESVVVDDYAQWEHAVPMAVERGLRSAMAVPLLAREGPVGAIGVLTTSLRHFGPDDVRVLSLLAAQLTPSLEAARLHASLAASERDFRAIFDTSPLAIARFDLRGRILEVNKAHGKLFGARPELMRGKLRDDLIAPADLHRDDEPWKELTRGRREQYRLERRYRKLDGSEFWADVTVRLVRDLSGRPEFYYAMLDDVTERKRVEAARRESEERFRAVFDKAAIGILRLDLGGTIMEANPTLHRMLGYGSEELVGLTLARVVHPEDRDPRQFADLLEGRVEEAQIEVRYLHKYGVAVWGHTIGSVVRGAQGEPLFIIAMVEDITVRKVQEQALEHRALHDALTDLPNRSLLNDRLNQAILTGRREEESVALLVMDLDRFKEVNDAFGHHSGDILLQQVALRLREELRGSDTVARLGGDEFAMVLPSIGGLPGAARAARKILRALEAPFTIERETVDIGASLGIALFPDHGEDADTLLRHSDVAMYVAKRSGTGFAFYTIEQDTHSPTRLALLAELRHAIEEGNLMLHYQPKLEMRSGHIVGAEALVRWEHPQQGLLMPDDFIPLAEHTGLIRPLGLWVIDAALRQCRAWQRAGLKLKLAINLSMRNLHDPQLPETFERLLKRHGLAAGWLQVEITESALMADPEHSMRVLTALERMGIRLAVDDYGTGYSSLAYLRRLPVEELKIDKSFVLDMAREENDAVIVRSTIELGHNLGLTVTAEGVEDRQTWDLLAANDCDLAQGYFFSQPLTARELNRMLRMQTLKAAVEA